jgi:hypothetical protein
MKKIALFGAAGTIGQSVANAITGQVQHIEWSVDHERRWPSHSAPIRC